MKSTRKFVFTNEVLDRLQDVFELKNDADLARFLEVNPSTVATWRRSKSMKFDRIFGFAEQVNLHWLLTGEGSVLPPGATRRSDSAPIPSTGNPEQIPYLESIPGRHPASVGEPDTDPPSFGPTLDLALPEAFVRQELDSRPEDLVVCRAPEDSMKPTIRHRNILLVNRSIRTPVTGRIFLIRLQQSLICRRVQVLPKEQLQLISDNPSKYPSMKISTDADELELIGMVVWAGRPV